MKWFFKFVLIVISVLVLGLAVLLGLILTTKPVFYDKPCRKSTNEVTEQNTRLNNQIEKIEILTPEGKLSKVGWTNNDNNLIFDSSRINPTTTPAFNDQLNKYRFKKWDAYAFVTKEYVGTFAMFDLGYLGGILFHIAKISSPNEVVDSSNNSKDRPTYPIVFEYLSPGFHPKISNQCSSSPFCTNGVTDSIPFSNSELKVLKTQITPDNNHFVNFEFARTQTKPNTNASSEKSNNDSSFHIKMDLRLTGKDLDSIVTLTPINEDSSLFYYNVKSYTLKSVGKFEINGVEIDQKEVLFAYDAGRGAWPLKSGWVWITGGGFTEAGEAFGFNSGHGFTHPSAGFTEDSFFIDGKMIKIANLPYKQIDEKNEFGYSNFIFGESTASGNQTEKRSTCDLTFHVTTVKYNKVNLYIAEIEFNVYYGYYSGVCFGENSEEYRLKTVNGQIENKLSIW